MADSNETAREGDRGHPCAGDSNAIPFRKWPQPPPPGVGTWKLPVPVCLRFPVLPFVRTVSIRPNAKDDAAQIQALERRRGDALHAKDLGGIGRPRCKMKARSLGMRFQAHWSGSISKGLRGFSRRSRYRRQLGLRTRICPAVRTGESGKRIDTTLRRTTNHPI